MINAVLVFNNSGQPRLTKFYTQLETSVQQRLISEIFTLVSNRPPSACNFLPLPPLLQAQSTPSATTTRAGGTVSPGSGAASSSTTSTTTTPAATTTTPSDTPSLVTYRHYATLYFILISTATESPLALLDLIQVFVEALDRLFENVCELDLIFNFETLHAALAELVVAGVVVETRLDRVVAGVRAQGAVAKRPVNEGKAGGGGGGAGGAGVGGGGGAGVGGLGLGGLGAFGRGEGIWTGR
ncbi:clathrin adaptor complex small chain-domain-containing protein [Lineolata rhizophorae]|uniref:Clathrin adaptor complex small chain-domain-containing protein n=1 Tax=Lineolata rhizophorae TaxID=578093 RepID=A0A6A6P8W4_9PEZI|nr:clathrin adaptor complex small chain-domain-containing protein [Lineolata rhizophorae]